MNKFMLAISSVLLSLIVFTACDDDDFKNMFGENSQNIPTAILDNFVERYPHAKHVRWQKGKELAVVEFRSTGIDGITNDNDNTKAWFSLQSNEWKMTEMEMHLSALPLPVKEAFEQSEFARIPWTTDNEFEKITRNNASTLFIINVEMEENDKEMEIDLIYTEDGVLIGKEIDSDDNDHTDYLPETATEAVQSWLKVNFPNAKIIDIDIEEDGIEVEILDGTTKREVMFDLASNWIYTETETRFFLLPDIIQQAFKASAFAAYEVDDVKEYNTKANGLYYGLELEGPEDHDFEIYISADGITVTDQVPW